MDPLIPIYIESFLDQSSFIFSNTKKNRKTIFIRMVVSSDKTRQSKQPPYLSTAISNKDVLPSHCSVGPVDAEKLKYGKPFSVTYPTELSSSLMPVASHQKVAGREEIRFPTSSEASPRILVKILFSYWTNSINAQGNLSTVPMARTTPKSSKTRSLHSLIMTRRLRNARSRVIAAFFL